MIRSQRTLLLTAALFAGAVQAEAQRAFRTHTSPTGISSVYGTSVEGIGDVNGDGRPDYAIGGNGVSLGGNGAGTVQAFSGATGALLWTANGSGGWVPCPGGSGTTGDFFGFDMERISDLDGDGIDDIAVGAPFTGVPNGACRDPFFGEVRVLSGATGATVMTTLGFASNDFLGTAVKRLPDMLFDGIDEFVGRASSFLVVFDGATGQLFLTVPISGSETVVSAAGDFFPDGFAWEIAIGDPGADTVRVVDMLQGTTRIFTGPAGSQFGAALEFAPVPGSAKGRVLVGAPGENGGAGAVYTLDDQSGATRIATGAGTDALGSALAFGGNADLNPVADELLAGAPGGNYVRILKTDGTLVQNATGTSTSSFGASVDWIGGIVPNGFDEFIAGDPGTGFSVGQADVLFGGPAATLNQNFGPGCNPTGGTVPVLTQSTGLRPGVTYTLALSSAPSFATGIAALGFADSTGIPVPPCTIWMNPNFTPLTLANLLTNFAGNWNSPVFSIPNDPNLVGLAIAHQAGVFPPTGGTILFSNATSSTIGW